MRKIVFEKISAPLNSNGVKNADIIDYLNKTADKLNALCREIYKNGEAKSNADKN